MGLARDMHAFILPFAPPLLCTWGFILSACVSIKGSRTVDQVRCLACFPPLLCTGWDGPWAIVSLWLGVDPFERS
ncbi:hypothetical protein EV426DRAFT_605596 [Tirmania nivea]|nr:hypothetical protein EV426DRAFT_605596 [Tirmania nivea]